MFKKSLARSCQEKLQTLRSWRTLLLIDRLLTTQLKEKFFMQIDAVTVAPNKLLKDYLEQHDTIMQRFDYNPYKPETMHDRLADIKKTNYNRKQLVSMLTKLHEKWQLDDTVLANINRLNDSDSVVVIGGQQAGLLTGPLYTIHKIISIIVYARQQEEVLRVPVVPVFWIAGEDHDFDEINHVFLPEQDKMKKYPIRQAVREKKSVSTVEINHHDTITWLDKLFAELVETTYTKTLYNQLRQHLAESVTYVDFFARLTSKLFNAQGLVLIDSGDPDVREIETSYFKRMITKQPEIAAGVYRALQHVRQDGYTISVDAAKQDGHLFYHLDGERILLEKTAEDQWQGKNNRCQFSTEDLLTIASEHPERLSNNVVTRPLMQECLFPTLAFFAGPGELAYWSILKPAFQAIGYKMPPVLPRLSFSIIDRTCRKKIDHYHLSVDELINYGTTNAKLTWLAGQLDPPLAAVITEVKQSIERAHQPLRQLANQMDADLGAMAEKNAGYLFQQIDFLQKAMEKRLTEKHQKTLKNFNQIELAIHPSNGLQERSWNIVSLLNQYGDDWLATLVQKVYPFSDVHYLVTL